MFANNGEACPKVPDEEPHRDNWQYYPQTGRIFAMKEEKLN